MCAEKERKRRTCCLLTENRLTLSKTKKLPLFAWEADLLLPLTAANKRANALGVWRIPNELVCRQGKKEGRESIIKLAVDYGNRSLANIQCTLCIQSLHYQAKSIIHHLGAAAAAAAKLVSGVC